MPRGPKGEKRPDDVIGNAESGPKEKRSPHRTQWAAQFAVASECVSEAMKFL
jgi:hypothetical protein